MRWECSADVKQIVFQGSKTRHFDSGVETLLWEGRDLYLTFITVLATRLLNPSDYKLLILIAIKL